MMACCCVLAVEPVVAPVVVVWPVNSLNRLLAALLVPDEPVISPSRLLVALVLVVEPVRSLNRLLALLEEPVMSAIRLPADPALLLPRIAASRLVFVELLPLLARLSNVESVLVLPVPVPKVEDRAELVLLSSTRLSSSLADGLVADDAAVVVDAAELSDAADLAADTVACAS